MNKKELKSLIKEMVRESLTEIFVEMKLENIVEGVVRKQKPVVMAEARQQPIQQEQPARQKRPAPQVDTKQALRENLIKNVGISEDEWKNIYSDVNLDKLPPSGGANQMENPEFVSENDLRRLGLI